MSGSMFAYDDDMTELVLDFCRRRLSIDPVPLDFGGTLAGVRLARRPPDRGGEQRPRGPRHLRRPSLAVVVSCDSSRYLAFIPAAPTKAALLFDMIVSCASFPCTSWLEGAGVVMAENQALRLLADVAGLPEQAGGCFVSGGSNANLLALVVAREVASTRYNVLAHRDPGACSPSRARLTHPSGWRFG